MLKELLFYLLFFGIPAAATVFFVVSLCRYISAKKQYKKDPDCIKPRELDNRWILMVVSSVIWAVITLMFVGLIAIGYAVVAYM